MIFVKILGMIFIVFCSVFNTAIADDLQTAPGIVSPDEGQAGVVPSYQPPQPEGFASPPQTAPQLQGSVPPTEQQLPQPNANIELNPSARHRELEQCRVVGSDGAGLINPYMADSGPNLADDPNAWIWVPLGSCTRINAGDLSNIPQDILDKINTAALRKQNE